jgi:ABC-type polar amino acid transport system ATPase subunit
VKEEAEACPSDEELGAFAEGNVWPEDLPQMEAHIARCVECRDTVVFLFQTFALPSHPDSLKNRSKPFSKE